MLNLHADTSNRIILSCCLKREYIMLCFHFKFSVTYLAEYTTKMQKLQNSSICKETTAASKQLYRRSQSLSGNSHQYKGSSKPVSVFITVLGGNCGSLYPLTTLENETGLSIMRAVPAVPSFFS